MEYERIRRKIVSVLFIFIIAFMTACAIKEETGNASNSMLQIFLPKSNFSVRDADLIVEKINEYIEPILNARVNITFIPSNSYAQTIHQKMSSNEQIDIAYCAHYSDLLGWQQQKWVVELDTLLDQYGQGVYAAIAEEYIDVGKIGNNLYGLPTNRDMASNVGLEYRADIAEQYGIDMSNVHSFDDLTAVFQQVKEKCPDITPVAMINYKIWDDLGNNYGVLLDFANSTQIVNLYESQEYEQLVRHAYMWRKKGYVLDTISDKGDNFFYFQSGDIFSSFANGKPGFETQETRAIGKDMGFIELFPAFSCTSNISNHYYVIPSNSINTAKAMQFMNMMYSDPIISNLLIYGIEDIHYVFTDRENDIINFPSGIYSNTSGYAQFLGWRNCNQYIAHIWEGDSPDIWKQMLNFNRQATKSIGYGFVFNESNVEREIINCNAVYDQFANGLQAGFLNPDTALPAFQKALQDAGIETIIQEKQSQLDIWLSLGGNH